MFQCLAEMVNEMQIEISQGLTHPNRGEREALCERLDQMVLGGLGCVFSLQDYSEHALTLFLAFGAGTPCS